MSLACTLLGHRYGDPEVRREREERGEEVVTVTREVATCERCGELRVLSETTEVTAVVDRDAVETGEADAPTSEAEDPGAAADAPDADPSAAGSDPTPDPGTDEGVEIVETGPRDEEPDEATGGDAGPAASDPDGAGAPAGSDDPEDATPDPGETPGVAEGAPEADEDDGVILEDDDGEREYGQWPDHDDQWEPEPVDEADVAAGQADPDDEDGDGDGDEEGDDGPSFEEVDPGADLPDTYSCPSCGFVTEAVGSAYRAGDACPDCGEAYLVADGTERNH
jgi:ribosomal protein S27AE